MTEHGPAACEIRSDARGSHWIAWRVDAAGHREDAVVIVGETREEAETRAARFAEQQPR